MYNIQVVNGRRSVLISCVQRPFVAEGPPMRTRAGSWRTLLLVLFPIELLASGFVADEARPWRLDPIDVGGVVSASCQCACDSIGDGQTGSMPGMVTAACSCGHISVRGDLALSDEQIDLGSVVRFDPPDTCGCPMGSFFYWVGPDTVPIATVRVVREDGDGPTGRLTGHFSGWGGFHYAICDTTGVHPFLVSCSSPAGFDTSLAEVENGAEVRVGTQALASGTYETEWGSLDLSFDVQLRLLDSSAGACCRVGGLCEVTTQAECADSSTWQGASTSCSPDPCFEPLGACCAIDGTCSIAPAGACGSPAEWHGPGTICGPETCLTAGVEGNLRSGSLVLRASPIPFGNHLSLEFAGPARAGADLRIVDVSGRQVRHVWAGQMDGRPATITWNGRDDAGRQVAPGVYLVRLEAGSESVVCRLVKTTE